MGRKKGKLPSDRGDKPAPDTKARQDAFYANFAANVALRRTERNLTQIELAYRSGIARAYINRLESRVIHCNLFAAARIAKALGTTVDKLCREPE